MSNLKPKFLLSENLNRLAKWLRLLGYDAALYRSISMDKMIVLAVKERRIFLTRCGKIARRKEKFSRILINSERHLEQLQELRDYLVFDPQNIFSRCLLCSKILFPVSKDNLKGLVPDFILATQNEFKICRHCGRVYWQGTHYKSMLRQLEQLFQKSQIQVSQ